MNEIQKKVIESYDAWTKYWKKKDPRDNLVYMISKMKVDYTLLNSIDINNKVILNIGCSFPMDEIYFARRIRKWIAVDLSSKIVKGASKIIRENLPYDLVRKVEFQLANANCLPFTEESFDVVISFSTLDHIPEEQNRIKAVKEMSRVTKTGGHVVITVPNKLNILYYLYSQKKQKCTKTAYFYEHCFTPREIKRIGLLAGLQPIKFASTLSLPEINLVVFPRAWEIFSKIILFFLLPLNYFGRRMGYLFLKK